MSWYDNIEEEDSLNLPITINSDNEYLNRLIEILNIYLEKLKSISAEKDVIERVEGINNLIVDSFEKYFRGNIDESRQNIEKIFDGIIGKNLLICDLNKSFALGGFTPFVDKKFFEAETYNGVIADEPREPVLFKARLSDSIVEFDAYDMLHIPFNKRSLVKTQRFSIPGLPCMYFGTSSYVCWLELNKPIKSQFHVSAFEIDRKFTILNLISSWSMVSILSKENPWRYIFTRKQIIEDLILFWPLVCATSFKVKDNKDRSFKSEYVISQLLMQVINNLSIDGVLYYSKRIPFDKHAFPYCVNLALPAKYNGEYRISGICKYMKIKRPVNFEEYTLLKNDNIMRRETPYIYNSGILLAQCITSYSNSSFYLFDNYLREQLCMNFNVDDFNK